MAARLAVRARIARGHEIRSIEVLDRRCFPDDDPPEISARTRFWIAEVDGAAAGFGGLVELGHGIVYLHRCGVLAKWRGRGVQRLLIRRRVRWARRAGYRSAITYTAPGNWASATNLIVCGFRAFRPANEWAGADQWYFSRRL